MTKGSKILPTKLKIDIKIVGKSVSEDIPSILGTGFPFPSPANLLNPRIEPRSPALQADSYHQILII